jgi:hypothetical protein
MKRFLPFVFSALVMCALSRHVDAATQQEVTTYEARPVQASNTAISLRTKNVSYTANLGPMGTPQLPSGAVLATDSAAKGDSDSLYPSVLITISTTPVRTVTLNAVQKDDPSGVREVAKVVELRQDLQLMDATFVLKAFDGKDGSGTPQTCANSIVGLLPGATVSGAHTPWLNTLAVMASQLTTSLAPFFATVSPEATGATAAAATLAAKLFPPTSVPYQYAFLDNSDEKACTFGWYFKSRVDEKGAPTAILGLQTGVLLLKVPKTVKSITITPNIFTEWSDKNAKYGFLEQMVAKLNLPESAVPDLKSLKDLSGLPLLVPVQDAMSILNVTGAWDQFDDKTKLKCGVAACTNKDRYVLRSSLEDLLQPSKPGKPGGGGGN